MFMSSSEILSLLVSLHWGALSPIIKSCSETFPRCTHGYNDTRAVTKPHRGGQYDAPSRDSAGVNHHFFLAAAAACFFASMKVAEVWATLAVISVRHEKSRTL